MSEPQYYAIGDSVHLNGDSRSSACRVVRAGVPWSWAAEGAGVTLAATQCRLLVQEWSTVAAKGAKTCLWCHEAMVKAHAEAQTEAHAEAHAEARAKVEA
jgi:hypothetical protein